MSFYCGDETIQIYEIAERNSGRVGGKFLDRQKHLNPISGKFYCEKDMLIGQLLILRGYRFRIMKVDEYTEKYYEMNPETFKEANIDYVLEKIGKLGIGASSMVEYAKGLMEKMDKNKDGVLSFLEFTEGIKGMGIIITPQEEHTLMRRFDRNEDGKISLREFCSALCGEEIG